MPTPCAYVVVVVTEEAEAELEGNYWVESVRAKEISRGPEIISMIEVERVGEMLSPN
jgi:hypothetical protein